MWDTASAHVAYTHARSADSPSSEADPGEPKVIVENMPGASSMVLANYLAKRAPRDGTAIGAVNSALIFDPLFSGSASKAQFEGPDMTMIGNAVSAAAVLIAWKASGVASFDDLTRKKLVIGAVSRTGDTYVLPLAMKRLLGLQNLEIVTGYPWPRCSIPLDRAEVTGRAWDMEGISAIRPQWLKDGSINLIVQLAAGKMPEVPPRALWKDFVLAPTTGRSRCRSSRPRSWRDLYLHLPAFRRACGRYATPSRR